jgi:1,4-dihydroxy-2-naphthoate octaprenyltransferase
MQHSQPSEQKTLTMIQSWWMAIRPRTLPVSVAGVITGVALAIHQGEFKWAPALAALLVGILLQISSNLANDVFDYEHGTDTSERLGPTRVTQAGILTPRQVKTGLAVVIGLAVILGIYLTIVAGWPVIVIGVAAIASAVLYTAGPYPLGYYGFGDLFVFLFFGLAAVAGTFYMQAGEVIPSVWGMAVVIGLLVVNLLVVNNLRDIPTDQKTGKRTLAVRIGVNGSRIEYLTLQIIAYLLIPAFILLNWIPVWALITWLSIPYAYQMTKGVFTLSGKALNPILAGTSKLAFYVGVLFLIAIGLSKLVS